MACLRVGHFTALQMLSDVAIKVPALVEEPTDFGTGVRLDIAFDNDSLAALVQEANANSSFRNAFGSSINMFQAGYLICEVRQWCFQEWSGAQIARYLGSLDASRPVDDDDDGDD